MGEPLGNASRERTKRENLRFSSYEEAADWFETHDMADYEHRLIPIVEEVASSDASRPASEDAGLLGEGRVEYVDAPKDIAKAIECSEIVEDFLPPSEELVFKENEANVIGGRSTKKKEVSSDE
jgi:hypothetical protein